MTGAGSSPLDVVVADHVATVSFNRPHVLNAVNTGLLEELIRVFDELNDRPDVWCVILQGHGRAFCVGADQTERPTMTHDVIRRRRRIAPHAFGAIRNCIHPVIARVHGYALGSGLEMALACDLVVVADDTVMGLVEAARASIPAGGGTQLLPRLIGVARAKELIFTGRKFTAAEAAAWGIFNYVVPSADIGDAVDRLAAEIVAAAPISCTQAKHAINASMDMDVASGIRYEAALYERVMTTRDRVEALTAYREHRKPEFQGV